MNLRRTSRRGFSLVELLAVVLVLAVLAAVAIPLYTSQRRSAAARACKANIAAISASLSAYALRFDAYPADATKTYVATGNTGGIVSAPEGLTEWPKCPLGGTYNYSTSGGAATVACSLAGDHQKDTNAADTSAWSKTLAAPATDSLP